MMPSPESSRTNAERARAARQLIAAARRAQYARLRDGGLSKKTAGEQMRLSPRSLERYEADYQQTEEKDA